jgi:hypothetical protein
MNGVTEFLLISLAYGCGDDHFSLSGLRQEGGEQVLFLFDREVGMMTAPLAADRARPLPLGVSSELGYAARNSLASPALRPPAENSTPAWRGAKHIGPADIPLYCELLSALRRAVRQPLPASTGVRP